VANVCVSSACTLACPYCFAIPSNPSPAPFVDVEAFERRLDVLERWGIDEARLIGGEPTLHPAFPTLVERALARFPRLVVFTNGCVPERALRALEAVPPERCTALVNMTAYPGDGLPPSVGSRRRATLRRLGPRALAGVTVVEPTTDLGWLPPLIRSSGCRPAMRVGLAHPRVDGGNDFLPPKRYPAAGEMLVRLARVAAEDGVRLELDCGFVPCMFSDEGRRVLVELGADVGWRCGPVGDIDVDGTIVHCFPLASRTRLSPRPGEDAPCIRRRLASRVAPFRVAGIYRECSTCPARAALGCPGGCLAATVRRFHREEFVVAPPERPTDPEPVRTA
jgi:hypothetical protein